MRKIIRYVYFVHNKKCAIGSVGGGDKQIPEMPFPSDAADNETEKYSIKNYNQASALDKMFENFFKKRKQLSMYTAIHRLSLIEHRIASSVHRQRGSAHITFPRQILRPVADLDTVPFYIKERNDPKSRLAITNVFCQTWQKFSLSFK